ncbi:MAG: superoxide dismutase family protein [Eubacteriales bacterium]
MQQTNNPCIVRSDIKGGPLAPDLEGVVIMRPLPGGTEVYTHIKGLPPFEPAGDNSEPIGPHGFHIHENGDCTIGDENDPFQAAGEHWNPDNQPHGNHAGDFPVLFSNNGEAIMSFFTNKFRTEDVIDKSIIIHESPDDYRSQPAGNAGKRLACGIIRCITDNI